MPRRHRFRALQQEVQRRCQRQRLLGWILLALVLGIPVGLIVHGMH